MSNEKPKTIAFYLPQYYPIPENDLWWGKGFTEWTNVGKAKPLYFGHYQPHVPADLGYYDLRVEETRIEQAELAKKYGLDGFCYWHYWFGKGKKLLEKPLDAILATGKPDFPICLGWANHSWEAKRWGTKKLKNKILIEQNYCGIDDCIAHYKDVSHAFKDQRYIKIDGKPVFLIWDPIGLPTDFNYLKIWQELAIADGFNGVFFLGFTYSKDKIKKIQSLGYDYVVFDALFEARDGGIKALLFIRKIIRELFYIPLIISYKTYAKITLDAVLEEKTLPCILPNFDHTPRSGKGGFVLKSTPKDFERLLKKVVSLIESDNNDVPLLFIKSWNEWGEGNHLEPDLKYGHSYLEAMQKGLNG